MIGLKEVGEMENRILTELKNGSKTIKQLTKTLNAKEDSIVRWVQHLNGSKVKVQGNMVSLIIDDKPYIGDTSADRYNLKTDGIHDYITPKDIRCTKE